MVVILKEEASRELERVRQELTLARVQMLPFTMNGAEVIVAYGADSELADRVRLASPATRVIFPVPPRRLADVKTLFPTPSSR